MGYTVRMPQLGMTMEEGVVVEWPVDEGDAFSEGDVIAVIESEKTTNEVTAREDGVLLERFVDFEEPVEPGDPIAYVGDADEEVPGEVREEIPSESGSVEAAATSETAQERGASRGTAGSLATRQRVSPRARAYAAEADFDSDDFGELDGSGPDGAVIERDVIEAVESAALEGETASKGGTEAAPVTPGASDATGERAIYEEREGTRLRRSIARQMTASAERAPQVTLNRTVSVEALLDLKARLVTDRNLELSISDFLLKAVARTLREHPEFNAIYEDGTHKLAANVNVGIAVDLDGGLVTPVLRGIDELSIAEINAARSDLVERVQANDYTGDDLANGTFTVTNLGHFGVESFDPLLNVPEVAILGVGTIAHEPTGDGETERCIGLSLTFDHRPNDGADAARFLDTLADELEHPLRLLSLGRGGGSTETTDERAFLERDDALEGERRAKAVSEGDMKATVRSRRFEWSAGEPEERGGDDSAPTPVEQFLGSLCSCLALMIGTIADRRDVEIAHVEVEADAEPEHDPIERIDVDVRIVSDDDESIVERVVQTAERACYVNRAVNEDLDRSLSITVEAP